MDENSGITKILIEKRNMLDSQCYLDGDYIILKVRYEYDIALSRCNTPEKILGWTLHLLEKSWVTKDLLNRFILLATNKIGISETIINY